MLKRTCIFLATLSFLVVLGLPIAQAQSDHRLIAHVPFDFYVRDRAMSAGDYTIKELADGSVLLISSADGRDVATAITNAADAKGRQANKARLVFRRYGDQYFLAAAWQNAQEGRALIRSRRERSLRDELALGGQTNAEPETVIVIASLANN